MHQQMNQNMNVSNDMGRLREPAHDETKYAMPGSAMQNQGGVWTYGDPELTYDGSQPGAGVSDTVISGAMTGGSQDTAPMPIMGLNGGVYPSAVSSRQVQSQRMKNPVDMSVTHSPADSGEAYQASLRSLLDRNVGYFVVCTFQIGTQQMVTWQGILHTVGSDYLVLYQPDYERYVSCDFYALKFVQFHNVKGVPYCAAARSWQGRQEM